MALCPDVLADAHASAEPLFETVVDAWRSLPSCCSRLWIALSGGCDSITLLHCAARARHWLHSVEPCRALPELHALHINHHLQNAAADFEQLCRTTCTAWGVALHVEHVDIDLAEGGGLEAMARDARYAAFERQMGQSDVVWMAHHADDQAETVLQRAMRGSGVVGMAGMPAQRALGQGQLMRPLLNYRRKALEDYAQYHHLQWCEDPSNASQRYDRNYLRHTIVPHLTERWPHAVVALGQVAAHAREAHELLNTMADRHLMKWPNAPQRLPIDALCAMGDSEARLVIRRALVLLRLAMPPRARLDTVLAHLSAGQGHVHWPGGEVRLWQGTLYLASNSADQAVKTNETLPDSFSWQIVPQDASTAASLRFAIRQGGERLLVNGRHRSIKALFQDQHIPPWQRPHYWVAWSGDLPVALVSAAHVIAADGWRVCQKPLSGECE